MKRSYKMQDLECANCAAKMEDAIKKIEGVNDVRINFMTQKMVLDADDSRFESILDEAARTCTKFEPDVTIIR
jgi:copper chaperone CopZ